VSIGIHDTNVAVVGRGGSIGGSIVQEIDQLNSTVFSFKNSSDGGVLVKNKNKKAK